MKLVAITSLAVAFALDTAPDARAEAPVPAPPQPRVVDTVPVPHPHRLLAAPHHIRHRQLVLMSAYGRDRTTFGIHPTDLTNKVVGPWFDIPSVAAPDYRARARQEIIGTAYFDEPMLRVPYGVNTGLPRSGGDIGGAHAWGTHVSDPYANYRTPWYTRGAASHQRTIIWYGHVR